MNNQDDKGSKTRDPVVRTLGIVVSAVFALFGASYAIDGIQSSFLSDILLGLAVGVTLSLVAYSIVSTLTQILFVNRNRKPDPEKFQEAARRHSTRAKRERIFQDFEHVYTFYIDVESRISSELENISKRAYLNLLLGLGTSIVALSLLFVNLSFQTESRDVPTWLVMVFLPRLTFALLIEALAFYFLRIYKESIDSIKYLTNELTNIDMKILGTMIAMEHNQKSSLDIIAKNMVATERNPTLNAGETTSENRTLVSDPDFLKRFLETINTLINLARK